MSAEGSQTESSEQFSLSKVVSCRLLWQPYLGCWVSAEGSQTESSEQFFVYIYIYIDFIALSELWMSAEGSQPGQALSDKCRSRA